jgi:hypothetical protein
MDYGQAWTQCSLLDYVRFDTSGFVLFSVLAQKDVLEP